MARRNSDFGKVVLGLFLIIPLVVWVGYRMVAGINFDRYCEGYIKQAADANTVEVAKPPLRIAVAYMEANGMTQGFTSVIYRSPDEDVGFWYKNVKTALDQLESIPTTASENEKAQVLLKLRQTLLDHGSEGEGVTAPSGISVFPNNAGVAFVGVASLLLALVGAFLILIGWD